MVSDRRGKARVGHGCAGCNQSCDHHVCSAVAQSLVVRGLHVTLRDIGTCASSMDMQCLGASVCRTVVCGSMCAREKWRLDVSRGVYNAKKLKGLYCVTLYAQPRRAEGPGCEHPISHARRSPLRVGADDTQRITRSGSDRGTAGSELMSRRVETKAHHLRLASHPIRLRP